MPHHIFLAHLQSLQKQLDFLVHKHLEPLEVRSHFVAQQLEGLPSLSAQKTDTVIPVQDRTISYKSSSLVDTLTEQLQQNHTSPELWYARAKQWNRLKEPSLALSDYSRSLALLHERIENTQTPKEDTILVHKIHQRMSTIHAELTQRIFEQFRRFGDIPAKYIASS